MRCTCGRIIGDHIDTIRRHLEKDHQKVLPPMLSVPKTDAELYAVGQAVKGAEAQEKQRATGAMGRHRPKRG